MPTTPRLLTANECDRLYRRREGTAAAAYRAGQLRGRWTGKPSRGRPGKTLLVSATQADELFGLALTTATRKTA